MPYETFRTADGEIAVGVGSDRQWLALCDLLNAPAMARDERFATNTARMRHDAELQEVVRAWVRSRPRDEVLEILDRFEVVAAAVNDSSDIVADPHFRERTLVDLAGTILGPVVMPGPVLHVASYLGPAYVGVPAIGEHTRQVLTDILHMSEDEQAELARRSVVGMPELSLR